MPTLVSTELKSEWTLLTADDFLDWLEPGIRADLIDGERFMHSPVNIRHARLVDFLHLLMKLHVERGHLGEVLSEVWAVRLGTRNVFMPDICYFTAEQAKKLAATHAAFAPTMVVEVLSSTNSERDVGPKFAAYEEHGVKEYWILNPDDLSHRFYAEEKGILTEFGQGESRIGSRTLSGFFVERAWLDPLRSLRSRNALRRSATVRPEKPPFAIAHAQ